MTNIHVHQNLQQEEEGRAERTRGGHCYRPHVDIPSLAIHTVHSPNMLGPYRRYFRQALLGCTTEGCPASQQPVARDPPDAAACRACRNVRRAAWGTAVRGHRGVGQARNGAATVGGPEGDLAVLPAVRAEDGLVAVAPGGMSLRNSGRSRTSKPG